MTARDRWLRDAPLHKVAAYITGDTPEEREEIESYLEAEMERRDLDRELRELRECSECGREPGMIHWRLCKTGKREETP